MSTEFRGKYPCAALSAGAGEQVFIPCLAGLSAAEGPGSKSSSLPTTAGEDRCEQGRCSLFPEGPYNRECQLAATGVPGVSHALEDQIQARCLQADAIGLHAIATAAGRGSARRPAYRQAELSPADRAAGTGGGDRRKCFLIPAVGRRRFIASAKMSPTKRRPPGQNCRWRELDILIVNVVICPYNQFDYNRIFLRTVRTYDFAAGKPLGVDRSDLGNYPPEDGISTFVMKEVPRTWPMRRHQKRASQLRSHVQFV